MITTLKIKQQKHISRDIWSPQGYGIYDLILGNNSSCLLKNVFTIYKIVWMREIIIKVF